MKLISFIFSEIARLYIRVQLVFCENSAWKVPPPRTSERCDHYVNCVVEQPVHHDSDRWRSSVTKHQVDTCLDCGADCETDGRLYGVQERANIIASTQLNVHQFNRSPNLQYKQMALGS